MAEKCKTHLKDSIARCMWCNRALCLKCIGLKDRNKYYCKKCAKKLSEHIFKKNLRKAEAKNSSRISRYFKNKI